MLNKLDEIGGCLFEMTMALLKGKHGDNWWYDGIPAKIQNDCLLRCNEDRGIKEKEQYIFFIDYYAIAYHDWELFQDYFSFSKDGGKDKQLKWVKDLNKIRQTTHHPEKWPALKEQVAMVREYYMKVIGKYKMLKEKQDSITLVAGHG